MTDRDRLAADLHATHICVEMPDGRCITDHAGTADRLIALGWSRNLTADTLAYEAGREDGLREALDEERLARALHAVPIFCLAARQVMGRETSHADTDARLAAAIAKAYREVPMPRTEAGKRLLDEWADDHERVQLEPMVDAIEAEARIDGRASGVDYEQARIRAAVEAAFDKANEGLEPNEEWCLSRAAVLAIIDREDADIPISSAQLDWMDQHGRK